MPQFDLANFPSQILWLIIIFSLQYIIIAKFVVPGFKVLFDKRTKYVTEQLDEASLLSKKSDKLRLDYEKKLEETKHKQRALLKIAHEEIEATSQKRLLALEEELTAELKLHEKHMQTNQKKSLQDIDGASLDLATEMIQKLTNIKVTKNMLLKYVN